MASSHLSVGLPLRALPDLSSQYPSLQPPPTHHKPLKNRGDERGVRPSRATPPLSSQPRSFPPPPTSHPTTRGDGRRENVPLVRNGSSRGPRRAALRARRRWRCTRSGVDGASISSRLSPRRLGTIPDAAWGAASSLAPLDRRERPSVLLGWRPADSSSDSLLRDSRKSYTPGAFRPAGRRGRPSLLLGRHSEDSGRDSLLRDGRRSYAPGAGRALERSWQHMFVRAAAASDSSLLGEDMRSGVDGASISLRLSTITKNLWMQMV